MTNKYDLAHFDYHILKSMNDKELDDLSKEIRLKIIETVSHNGGHLSSNLGIVELTIALLREFDISKDDILFDVGHQTYTYKILTGRDISDIRLKDGLYPFQSLEESEYDKFEAGHSSTSLSVALGMCAAKKLRGDDSYTIAVIGDASIANGLALEALNNLDNKKYSKLIIILNDNGMSISEPQGNIARFFNELRTSSFYQSGASLYKKMFNNRCLNYIYRAGRSFKNALKRLFIGTNFFSYFDASYLGPIDGHNFKKLSKFLKRAKEIDESVILHVRTTKGKGYKPAEDDKTGYWHGVTPFDIDTGEPINNHEDTISFSHIGGNSIYKLMERDEKAVLIVPAMVKGSHLEQCFKDFKDRCYDVGIAEEHALTFASGLALKGMHPIISIYSTFLQRAYDELIHDLSRMNLSCLFVIDRAGVIGQDGSSHQGLFDVTMALGVPHTEIFTPSRGSLIEDSILNYDFDSKKIRLVRLEREYEDKKELETKNNNLDYDYINNNKSKLVLGIGRETKELSELVKDNYDVLILNRENELSEEVINIIKKYDILNAYDITGFKEGFLTYLVNVLHEVNYKGEVNIIGLEKSFVDKGNKREQLLSLGLDPVSVVSKLK